MDKQLRILMAGVLVVVPFAITVYVIYSVGAWLDGLGKEALKFVLPADKAERLYGLGAVLIIAGIYLIGLLTHFWLFRWTVRLFEKLFRRVPGVKTIYESIRDLLKLFGTSSGKMGRVVECKLPGGGMTALGILTSEQPEGIDKDESEGRVAVYLPFSYMIGGPIVYVSRKDIREVDMPVETALKLCATAQVGARAEETAAGKFS